MKIKASNKILYNIIVFCIFEIYIIILKIDKYKKCREAYFYLTYLN